MIKKYLRNQYKRLKELCYFTVGIVYMAVIIALVIKYI